VISFRTKKELAEHLMLVVDLAAMTWRVCVPGSVEVTESMVIEKLFPCHAHRLPGGGHP